MAFVGTVRGRVVAGPARVAKDRAIEFTIADNDQKKDDNGIYQDTGKKLFIKITSWDNEDGSNAAEEINSKDIVEFVGGVTGEEFTRKDGSQGSSIVSKWIDSLTVTHAWDHSREGGSQVESNKPTVSHDDW